MQRLLILILYFSVALNAISNKSTESQPEILFEHKSLVNSQDRRELVVKFNTAVLYLEQEKFLKAIPLLKDASKLLKVASFLNIGIAYYKLDSENNSYLYLRKIYDLKELKHKDKYSYFSAAYYLYKITNDEKYLNEIIKVSTKSKRLSIYEKQLLIDTLILQKRYDDALEIIMQLKSPSNLKIALINIKLRDYSQARIYLNKAYSNATGDKLKNKILWFKIFRDLKSNDLTNLSEDILLLEERKKIFNVNKDMKLELFFNKDKLSNKEYFNLVTKFTIDRKLDFVYYFAPFIFEDNNKINHKTSSGFIMKNINSLDDLNSMINYNAEFLKIVKLDPIERVQILQKLIDKEYDRNPYEYYNLGLSYAHIYDYINAYKYFKKAYNLEHANKLYSVMTILTAKKLKLRINKTEKEIMVKNIMSKDGSCKYLAKYLYKIFENPSLKLDAKTLTNKQKKSIFFRALYFLDNFKSKGIDSKEPLLVEFSKDPLVKLLTMMSRNKNESDYIYISRLQDEIPKVYNNNFLKGSLVITDYYLDMLHALGLFKIIDFNIPNEDHPTYLRMKSIVELYKSKPKETIKLINIIQEKYHLESIDIFYIQIAALFSSKQYELAYITLSEIELLYSDKDAGFLNGVKLIQDLKLNTAPQYFEYKLEGKLVDFKLDNFDNFLESL